DVQDSRGRRVPFLHPARLSARDLRRERPQADVRDHLPQRLGHRRAVEVAEQVALAPLTTMALGGPARFFVHARYDADVRAAWAWARAHGVPLRVLGGGSNVVVDDSGLDGLVVHLATRGIDWRETADAVEVTVAAGEPWDDLVRCAVARDWAGLECLSGIPGRVGATPIQNVGAYGQEVSDTISAVHAIDRANG